MGVHFQSGIKKAPARGLKDVSDLKTQQQSTAQDSRKASGWMCWHIQQFRRDYNLSQEQLAEMLRIPKAHLEILESPQDLVPEPVPNHIADRLNTIQQAVEGHVRKMPRARCLLHDCVLRQHRGRWPWRLRGKMKRWWAECVIGGELYTVRSDGLVQNAPRWKTGELGGRRPKGESERKNFVIGREVEDVSRDLFARFVDVKRAFPKQIRERHYLLRAELAKLGFTHEEIEAGLVAKTARIAARNFVASMRKLEFSTVAKYHREYLKSVLSLP